MSEGKAEDFAQRIIRDPDAMQSDGLRLYNTRLPTHNMPIDVVAVGGRAMDCGPNEPLCLLVDWLASHSHAVKQSFEFLDGLWNEAGGQVIKILKKHGEKLIAIASFSFGVWRWWIYRERILHKRLEEYINESDARLKPASVQAVDAILRPGRTPTLPQPAFALELHDILAKNGWLSLLRSSSIEKRAERKLGRALKHIRDRQQIARAALQSLLEQQAQVHLLAGAVATSRARLRLDRQGAPRDDHAALREFRKVLQFPAHDRDPVAKECEAFQLLRLGKGAMQAYEDLEDFAAGLPDERERDLTIARSKRFQAQILQANAGDAGTGAAWNLIANNNNPHCAVRLRRRYVPFTDWEAVEQAEIHLVAAWVAHKLAYVKEEPNHLSEAETAYGETLSGLPKRPFFVSFAKKRLRDEARAGLARVERAKFGDYDKQWFSA
jgi:hypothetical protein